MSIEKWHLNESREKKENSEDAKKQEIQRQLEFLREKKSLTERIEKDKKLAYLKSLIERGFISLPVAENIVQGNELETHELQAIFDKIEEMEEIKDIDDILPKALRVTKTEYLGAIQDPKVRSNILARLDQSLDYLHSSSKTGSNTSIVHFFSELLHTFDAKNKRIMKVQGNIIDIKRDLKDTE